MAEKAGLEGFESGVYGTPPSWRYWLRQAVLYVIALTTMKFLVIGLLALFPGLDEIAAWLLKWTWTEEGDALQVILYASSPYSGPGSLTTRFFTA
jgi:hypothetical protein